MHTPSFVCITFVGFVANLAWGIVMPGLWDFIEDTHGKHMHLGIAVSAFSLAQIFFLQIFGRWADKKPMKASLYCSFAIGTAAYLFYAFATTPYLIILARFLAGIEAGNLTVTNSFIAMSSTQEERTKYMAKMNGFNVVGFVIAPLINFGLLKIDTKVGRFHVGPPMASGLLIVALHVIVILMFVLKFKEPAKANTENTEKEALLDANKATSSYKSIPQKSKEKQVPEEEVGLLIEAEEEEEKRVSMDKTEGESVALPRRGSQVKEVPTIGKLAFLRQSFSKVYGVCLVAMFVQNFLFSFMITAITPITEQQYHFTPIHNSIVFSVTSLIMVVVIFVVSIVSHFVKNVDRLVIIVSQLFMGASLICLATLLDKMLTFPKLALVVALLIVGIPGQSTALTSIYSKFISKEYGPSKLGQFTGILLQAGAVASIFGPLWAGISVALEPIVMVSVMLVLVAVALCWTLVFFKKLVPPAPAKQPEPTSPKAFVQGIRRLSTRLASQEVAAHGLNLLALSTETYPEAPEDHQWVKAVPQYNNVVFHHPGQAI